MPPHIAYLGIGSNVGNRLEFCRQALIRLAASGIRLIKASSLYETQPVDYLDQDWFYNAVVEVQTDLAPLALLQQCQTIEKQIGKHIVIPKGPRTIDLDLLFYEDQVIHQPDLIVPHPSALKRSFVMIPLAQIAPDWKPPTGSQTIQMLLDTMSQDGQARPVSAVDWPPKF